MILDRNIVQEYPFEGTFFRIGIDESKDLIEQEEEEIIILETECDIQESTSNVTSGNISATFDIYFPFDKEKGIMVRRGDNFRGTMFGMPVNGKIDGVFPSQLGGCQVHLIDRTT